MGVARTAPGARARHAQAKEAALRRLEEVLKGLADEQGLLPLALVLRIAADVRCEAYRRGYSAGYANHAQRFRKLRLELSMTTMQSVLKSAFGKQFVHGDLRPEVVERFRFGFRK